MMRDLQRHVRLLLNQEDAGAVAIGLGNDEVSGGAGLPPRVKPGFVVDHRQVGANHPGATIAALLQ